MRPGDVRTRLLDDHTDLRARLERVDHLARELLTGRATVCALREHAGALHAALCTHLDWEDVHVAPVLRGRGRAVMARDHREQRELLAYVLDRLRDATRPPVVLARDLLSFAELLRADMAEEERRLLRDDPTDRPGGAGCSLST